MKTWLSSLGGPLICMEERFATSWLGIDGLSVTCEGAEHDYDRAGRVSYPYTSLLTLEGGHSALVLGGEPMDTILAVKNGDILMLRASTSEIGFDGDLVLQQMNLSVFFPPYETVRLTVTSSPLVVFDSTFPGTDLHTTHMDEMTGAALTFAIPLGDYLVLTANMKEDLYSGVLHYFKPV